DLDLGQEIHDVLRAAVEFGLALLPAVALRLDDRQALDAQLLQRLFHFVQLERLDDGFDLFHRDGYSNDAAPRAVEADGARRAGAGQARVRPRAAWARANWASAYETGAWRSKTSQCRNRLVTAASAPRIALHQRRE